MSGYVRKPVMGTVLTDRMGAATARWRCLPLALLALEYLFAVNTELEP